MRGKIDPEPVAARIREAARRETDLPDTVAADVAFHMTDWLDDLQAYSRFCAEPKTFSDEEVDELLRDILIHAPNHIAAAAKLYTGIPVTDIFNVGATEDDDRESS